MAIRRFRSQSELPTCLHGADGQNTFEPTLCWSGMIDRENASISTNRSSFMSAASWLAMDIVMAAGSLFPLQIQVPHD